MRALVVLLALFVALLSGCADDAATLPLEDWRLSGARGVTADVLLPTHVDGRLPKSRSHYYLRRTVTLGPALRGRDLVFVLPRLLAHVVLRVGGAPAEVMMGGGQDGFRTQAPHAWRIQASATSAGAIDLELDVDHTWTQSGWLDTIPRLTTAPDGGARFVRQRFFNDVTAWLALGFAMFVGYLYLVIFLTDVRRLTFLWFALTGIGGFFYPLFETGIAQRYLGPFETTLAAVGVSTSVLGQLHFTYDQFNLAPPRRGWYVAWAISCLGALASTDYFYGTLVGGRLAVVFAIPAVLTQVLLFARLARQKPRPVNLFFVLGGWVVLAAIGAPDFAAWGGLGELLGGTRPACCAIFVIAVLQTMALSREHTASLRRADELAKEREERIRALTERNREVEILNDELRRQVGARSRVLADALSRDIGTVGEKTFEPGETVEGRYTVMRVLGSGAAGTVYLVERTADKTMLAMKVVRGASDRYALARLAREAQLAAEVKHENVITIVDVDVAATGTGFLYVVMEYIAGDSLREHRNEYGAMKWSLDVLRQIAAGLAAVHGHGIVHRDLKPANVLLVPRDGKAPLVKIADFGIASGSRDQAATLSLAPRQGPVDASPTPSDLRLTQTGMLLGTPLYMAPEAIEGAKNATPAIDMFSFGVIAYEVLTSVVPFTESPALAQLQGVNVAPPDPIGEIRKGLPIEVSKLIDRCLAFEAGDRPSAAEARDILASARMDLSAGRTA